MKVHTTMKMIRICFSKVFRAGYCDLQYIMSCTEPQYYNSGVYGWNCDIYANYSLNIAITTGYRNMAGKMIPSEIIKKYSDIAKAIMQNGFSMPYEEKKRQLDENRENFWNALDNL